VQLQVQSSLAWPVFCHLWTACQLVGGVAGFLVSEAFWCFPNIPHAGSKALLTEARPYNCILPCPACPVLSCRSA
jgi:hypothetical protein